MRRALRWRLHATVWRRRKPCVVDPHSPTGLGPTCSTCQRARDDLLIHYGAAGFDKPQTRGETPDYIIVDDEPHECPLCEGTGWADDPSACSDPEHCSPGVPCPNGCIS